MEDIDKLRAHIIETALMSIPKRLLADLNSRIAFAYADTFQEVKQTRTTLDEHRLSNLRLMRPFRMDWELAQAAKAEGLAFTAKPLPENDWSYTYVAAGGFGLTQSYVPYLGSLPQPAKYREELANAADVPRLAIDDPKEIYERKTFYGLLAHNPVGRRFREDDQKLGALQLCVPYPGMKAWALEIGVVELMSLYPADAKPASEEKRGPSWKAAPAKKKDQDGAA